MSTRKLKIQKLQAQKRRMRLKLEKAGLIYFQPKFMEENAQLKFLLSQCPLMNAIGADPFAYSARMPKMRVYINPKTYRDLGNYRTPPVQWVLTDLLPEGGMICSPNTMPGIAPLPEKKS